MLIIKLCSNKVILSKVILNKVIKWKVSIKGQLGLRTGDRKWNSIQKQTQFQFYQVLFTWNYSRLFIFLQFYSIQPQNSMKTLPIEPTHSDQQEGAKKSKQIAKNTKKKTIYDHQSEEESPLNEAFVQKLQIPLNETKEENYHFQIKCEPKTMDFDHNQNKSQTHTQYYSDPSHPQFGQHSSTQNNTDRLFLENNSSCKDPYQSEKAPYQFDQNPHQSNKNPHQSNKNPHQSDKNPHQSDKKPIEILQQNFDQWFHNDLLKLYPNAKTPQIYRAKKKFINYIHHKLNSKQIIDFSQTQSKTQNQQSNNNTNENQSNAHIRNSTGFSLRTKQDIEKDINDMFVDNFIKENTQLIDKQKKWQQSPECPITQKITHLRKQKQIIASFIFEGYGMAAFKRHFVKKILNNEHEALMLFPLVKDHWFYKKQSRPIAKKAFGCLQHFLKQQSAFPQQTNGYVDLKETQMKYYITPLLNCRSEFEHQIAELFIRIIAHIFDFHKETHPEKQCIGLTVTEAQILYIKIIQKYQEKKRVGPKIEIQRLGKFYHNFVNKKNPTPQNKQIIPNRSMVSQSENQNPKFQHQKTPNNTQPQISIVLQNTPLKEKIESLYIKQYLNGYNLQEITEIISQTLSKPLEYSQTQVLHQICIKKAFDYTKNIQKTFLSQSHLLNDYLKANPNLSAEFFLQTMGQRHNIKLITWSREFQSVRKKMVQVFQQKGKNEEDIIEIWYLFEEGFQKLRQNRQKGRLKLLQKGDFLEKKHIHNPNQGVEREENSKKYAIVYDQYGNRMRDNINKFNKIQVRGQSLKERDDGISKGVRGVRQISVGKIEQQNERYEDKKSIDRDRELDRHPLFVKPLSDKEHFSTKLQSVPFDRAGFQITSNPTNKHMNRNISFVQSPYKEDIDSHSHKYLNQTSRLNHFHQNDRIIHPYHQYGTIVPSYTMVNQQNFRYQMHQHNLSKINLNYSTQNALSSNNFPINQQKYFTSIQGNNFEARRFNNSHQMYQERSMN